MTHNNHYAFSSKYIWNVCCIFFCLLHSVPFLLQVTNLCYIIICIVYALYDFKQHYPSVVICYDSFKHSSLLFTPASNVNSIIYKTLSYILYIINPLFVATKTKNMKLQMFQIFHTMNNIFEACCLIMLSVVMNRRVSFIDE